MTWPTLVFSPLLIHPHHISSLGVELGASGGPRLSSAASAAYPAASRAIYVPFRLSAPLVAVQMFVWNGATASGNLDVGIYTADGTRIVSSGSTAQDTGLLNVLQPIDITDTELGPGNYYLAIALDNATGTFFRSIPTARAMEGLGCFQQASAFALPATATFAAVTSSYLPSFGFTTRSVL